MVRLGRDRFGFDELGDHLAGGRPDFSGFAQEVIARPQSPGFPHICRDVVRVGDVHPAGTCELVGGDAVPGVKDGEHVAGDAHIYGAAYGLVRHRVMRGMHGDVEVRCDFGAFTFGALRRCFRQRS